MHVLLSGIRVLPPIMCMVIGVVIGRDQARGRGKGCGRMFRHGRGQGCGQILVMGVVIARGQRIWAW